MTKTSRRGRGEGGVRQRSDGRWEGTLSLQYDSEGNRRRRYVYASTKKDCLKKLREAQLAQDAKKTVDPERLTLLGLYERWMEVSIKPHKSPRTVEQYRGVFEKHILPNMGKLYIHEIQPLDIQDFLGFLDGKKVGSRTRQVCLGVLRRAFTQAMAWRLVKFNPTMGVVPPKLTPRTVKSWTPDEAQRYIAATRDHPNGALFALAISVGLRMGELLGLYWRYVDLANAQIEVAHAVVESKGRREIKAPKSRAACRVVPIPAPIVDALANRERKHALVFCGRTGAPYTRSAIRGQHIRIFEATGLPKERYIRFHDLRRTCATLLAHLNVPPRVAQEILGHADIRTTLALYTDTVDADRRNAVDLLTAKIGGRLAVKIGPPRG